jgi:two-component sensor histidine kinase
LANEIIQVALRALPRGKHIILDVPASPIRVTSDQAHNLALVINELATNTIKYALEGRNTAKIAFRITSENHTVRCEFRDDGLGYPEDVLQLERHNVGFDLIQNIVRGNLRGELSLYNDHGAVAIIQFRAEV